MIKYKINIICFTHSDTKLWDIIAEVVKLCMYPSPLNPFAVDFKYFEGLPLVQRVIATGAMAHFLQKVVASGDHAYNARGTRWINIFRNIIYYKQRKMVHFKLGEEIRKDGMINMSRAWDEEKLWVPNWNRTHDLPYTGQTL